MPAAIAPLRQLLRRRPTARAHAHAQALRVDDDLGRERRRALPAALGHDLPDGGRVRRRELADAKQERDDLVEKAAIVQRLQALRPLVLQEVHDVGLAGSMV